MLARLHDVTLGQPVLRHRSLEANVVTPAKPCVALEDVSHLMKRGGRLLVLARVNAMNPAIDQRVGLGLEHVMPARNVDAVFVVLVRRFKVVELAENPADTIRETRVPEE